MADGGKKGGSEDLVIPDELEFEPVERRVVKKSSARIIYLTIVLLVVAGGAGWYFIGDQLQNWFPGNSGTGVPFIRADETPVKVRPKNPGGMNVPNRDKLIYGRLRGAGSSPPPVERLMPLAEKPLPVPKPKPSSSPVAKNSKASADMTKSLEAAVSSLKVKQPTVPPVGEVVATTPPASPPPVPKSSPAPGSVPVPKSSPVTQLGSVSKPGNDRKGKTVKAKGFQIQVGAVRSPTDAKSEWQRLRRKNPKLLGKMKLFITKADLGPSRGIFYRLRAGPIKDASVARKLCKELTKRKVGCLIVRPGE